MIHYHVWFSLRPELEEAEGLAAARAFLADLTQRGSVARARLLRNTRDSSSSELGAYQALFEFTDDEQMKQAFAAQRTVGCRTGSHGPLVKAITNMHVEVFREV